MENKIIIRPIRPSDAAEVLEIYRPYIENTNITFEYTVPPIEEWEKRIQFISRQFPWLVAEYKGKITGYAYATKHRERIAYSWCCESSVYLLEEFHGKGIANMLYEKLFGILKQQGYINVYAILTSPNPASEKFHENFGFYDVGRFHKAGFKFGKWHDTRWMQLHLSRHETRTGSIVAFSEMINSEEVKNILKS